MSTLSVYHDCSHITWRWLITGLGSRVDEVKGINVFTVNTQGQLIENDLEFNSIAWGKSSSPCAPSVFCVLVPLVLSGRNVREDIVLMNISLLRCGHWLHYALPGPALPCTVSDQLRSDTASFH